MKLAGRELPAARVGKQMSPDRQQCMRVESLAAVDNVGTRDLQSNPH